MRIKVGHWMLGVFTAALFALAGCGSGSDSVGVAAAGGRTQAKAGAAQQVTVGTLVTLDGSQSGCADDGPIPYQWSMVTKPAGSTSTLNNATTAHPTFTPDLPGTYSINLKITDTKSVTSEDTVTVTAIATAHNTAPVANAGNAQNVLTGTVVSLDGSASSDPDGDLLTYSWSFLSKPSGSGALLSNPTGVTPSFTPDVAGIYILSLVVNDSETNSAEATVSVTASAPGANATPVAHAGPAQNVVTGSVVTLDGSGSSDADHDLLTYSWDFASKPNGSGAALSNPTAVNPTFTPDVDGPYVVVLVVNDGKVNSAAAQVTITASRPAPAGNAAPVARAGSAQNVITGTLVVLDGSGSSDADGDLLSFTWRFTSKPRGSSAALSNTTDAKPTFIPDLAGSYVLNLVVSDGKLESAAATVIITASAPDSNAAPNANAGQAQNVMTGTPVTLDGSGSSDANGDVLTYRWQFITLPAGSSAVLSNATTAQPVFTPDVAGSYVVSLIVNDGKVDSSADTVTVTASAINAVPVANAGTDQRVAVGTLVTLDGSASSDANGDPLTFTWTVTAVPSGSGAALSSTTSVRPTFIPDLAGTYVVRLIVSDGKSDSAASTVSITSIANSGSILAGW